MSEKFGEVRDMSDTLVIYNTVFGINIILMLLIFLKSVDFQPRLGVLDAGP